MASPHVVVIEDDPGIGGSLARTLEGAGYEVSWAPSGSDALARNAGRVVPRGRLIEEVWDERWFGSTKTLDIHVWALRRKLDGSEGPSRIGTVRGVGYRLEAP